MIYVNIYNYFQNHFHVYTSVNLENKFQTKKRYKVHVYCVVSSFGSNLMFIKVVYFNYVNVLLCK